MRNTIFEEDRLLAKAAGTPSENKPRFDWAEALGDNRFEIPKVRITDGAGDRDFHIAEVAEVIGEALTNLMISREENEIYTPKNRALVVESARIVADRLIERMAEEEEGGAPRLSFDELHRLIEKALVENDAYDVAKSLVISRSNDGNGRALASNGFEDGTGQIRLIRRSGQVVPWNYSKIEVAMRKAFLSLQFDSEPAVDLARQVTRKALSTGQAFINIEDVQDLVQEELMRKGHFKVAESYILYRARRRIERETGATGDEIKQDSMIVVQKKDGSTFFWDGIDLKKRIAFGSIGLDLCMTTEQIEECLRRSVFSEISEDDLRKTIILNSKTLIERDGDFAKFAARILLSYVYEEVLGWDISENSIEELKGFHSAGLKQYLKRGIEIKRLDPKLLKLDIGKLAEALDPSADLDFDYLGIQTLFDRYLVVDKTNDAPKRLETPQLFWMRVAMGVFAHEESPEDRIIALYNLYKSRRFCSSTPTLFNSGTLHSQLSSCYLYKVDDTIESIMYRGIAENAFLSKWAGGLGGSWTSVRGTGSHIAGTNGESQGVIPFLKMHNDQLCAVNQGGKRKGSGCAYLESWHCDVLEFLELRKNTGDDRRRTHDMNTANWIPDLFMKRMEARKDWTLFRSNEVPELHDLYGKAFEDKYAEYEAKAEKGEVWGHTMPALDLWKQMLKMLFETGHPWITFKDTCNIRSPQDHVGVIHSSNLCTEITLNTGADETAVCNLGSVVLDSHLKSDGAIDHDKLRDTIRTAVRALDNVIDVNFYPTDAAKTSNMRHRPIGLGVMGLQNSLFLKNIPFSSQDAVEFNDEFMEAICYYAYEASSDLASERGSYSSFRGSKWDRGILPQDSLELLEKERGSEVEVPKEGKMDWSIVRDKIAKHGMRNSNVIAIAPTATISNIMGSSPCIEPTYKNLFVKSNLSGDFMVLNRFLVTDLKKEGLWDREMSDQLKYFDGELSDITTIPDWIKSKYLTAFDVSFEFVIAAAARRQKWIDQSQSVNLFLGEPDLKALSHMYRAAWRQGLKTTYYLRTLGASNIEKATVDLKQKKPLSSDVAEEPSAKKEYTDAEKKACSIEAMMNGEDCEACQ
ncbi:MAG: ribonucleoside-diphosphate reductase subunit alpha [Opitutae bacterium]|nr:ribonucleoside-diphosphate reductase subunit alpha [Opitutae bacterium]|tara:strand:- start:6029 stop:9295 length:3267 start_codon:yes stop_codon:yes gene_type:complete